MTQASQLKEDLRKLFQERGIIAGTEEIAIHLTTVNCKRCVLQQARALENEGAIAIIRSRGGRGKKTIYKRNPNQPGIPRRKRGGR